MSTELAVFQQLYANACDAGKPFVRLRPRIFLDGDQWCALYGENLQNGVAGFGRTPQQAEEAFNGVWLHEQARKK